MSRPSRTWIVIADAARAKIMVQAKAGEALTALEGGEFQNPALLHHSRDFKSDRPSRSMESAAVARHAIEPRHDPRRLAARDFAKELSAFVERSAIEKSYDRLVIVAPPHMLSDLRHALGRHADGMLIAGINKDLTKIPLHELPRHLEPVVHC